MNKDDYHKLPKVYYDLLEFTEDFLGDDNLSNKRTMNYF